MSSILLHLCCASPPHELRGSRRCVAGGFALPRSFGMLNPQQVKRAICAGRRRPESGTAASEAADSAGLSRPARSTRKRASAASVGCGVRGDTAGLRPWRRSRSPGARTGRDRPADLPLARKHATGRAQREPPAPNLWAEPQTNQLAGAPSRPADASRLPPAYRRCVGRSAGRWRLRRGAAIHPPGLRAANPCEADDRTNRVLTADAGCELRASGEVTVR
jgi:hypothetical protein